MNKSKYITEQYSQYVLDSVLDKISKSGIDSLTNYEKDILNSFSDKITKPEKSSNILIGKVSGEFLDSDGKTIEYINPNRNDSFWKEFEKAKKEFETITLSDIDIDIYDAIDLIEDGYIPKLYLFSYEIPKNVWDEINSDSDLDVDIDTFISDYSDYEWKLEAERILEIQNEYL